MINFFRKARKEMADDNRPIKYMRYAIGEIVLVVIGILIALSINNWNENRKTRITELTYLENIKTDLQLNITSLDTFITSRKTSIKSTNIVIEYFEKTKPINFNDFNYHSLIVMVWYPFEQNDNTYQELMNSGQLSIISNKTIKNNLQNINAGLNKITFIESEMQQDFETYLYEPFFTIADMNTSLKNFDDQITKSANITELDDSQINELLANQKFKNGFMLSSYNSDLLITEYTNMMETTKEIISLIDDELNQ